MQVNQNVKIHNRFDIEVRDGVTGELKQEAVAYNIVLDQMYTRLCGGSSYFVNIHFGTGVGVVVPTRTSLFSHLGTKAVVNEELIKAIPLSKWKCKIVLNPEEYIGQTLTEVGVAFGGTSTNLVTHALLKDSEGNPISITKTATDVVTIYATVFVTFAQDMPTLKLMPMPISNSLVNYLIGGATFPTGTFGLLPGENHGVRLGATATATWITDVTSKQRKTNVARFDINTANGQVKSLDFTNLFSVSLPTVNVFLGQSYADTPVGVGDGTKKEFELSSKNIQQDSIVVKLDGVISAAYVKSLKSNYLNFKIIDIDTTITAGTKGIGLSSDGNVLVVSTDNSPYIFTYDWDGTSWIKRPTPAITPASTTPNSASITPDGNIISFSHSIAPYVEVYDWNGTNWIKRVAIPDPLNGPTGAVLSANGTVLATSNMFSPYMSTYGWDGANWAKRPTPSSPPSNFNRDVAISADGNRLVMAFQGAPYMVTYFWDGAAWIRQPTPAINIGENVKATMTPDGNVIAFACSASPYVIVYDWNVTDWISRSNPTVLSATDFNNVGLSDDGSIVACAFGATPYIIVYDWDGTNWIKRPTPDVVPSYGLSVKLSSNGDKLVMGHDSSPWFTTYDCKPRTTAITFGTAPPVGTIITADYTVDGIHKTDQYVVDASFAIQFGEGV